RARAQLLDWDRLLERFGPHWRVLLSHLVLFGFIYPREHAKVPNRIMELLLDRLRAETHAAPPNDERCQGTLLSRAQYLHDVQQQGYEDGRGASSGSKMTREDIAAWTAAIDD